MKRLKAAGLGFIASAAIVAAFALGLLASSQVRGQDDTVSIGRVTAAPGAQATVDLAALNIGAPGLAAWLIDITYDPVIVAVVACSPQAGSVCNASFAPNKVRVAGASAFGHVGDTTLATITFRCEREGSIALTLGVAELADTTIGEPQHIDAAIQDGGVACVESPVGTPSSVPPLVASPLQTASPTPSPALTSAVAGVVRAAGVPQAGTGGFGSDRGSALSWLIAGLAGAGIAWLIAGLAGAGWAAVTSSSTMRLPATGDRHEADDPLIFVPKTKARRTANLGGASLGKTTAILTSRPAGLVDRSTDGADSDGRRACRWLMAAREDLAGTRVARIAAFRLPRRRKHRS